MEDEFFKKLQQHPVSKVWWQHRDTLNPNLYNPNRMAPPEMDLLVQSIKNDGWLFPILVLPLDVHIEGLTDNEAKNRFTIIDGFHRYMISGHEDIYPITDGYVPVTTPGGTDYIATTVRMNRVKGTHSVLGMSDIVTILIKQGRSKEYIMREYGMEEEEVIRLANKSGIPKSDLLSEAQFSKAWQPE